MRSSGFEEASYFRPYRPIPFPITKQIQQPTRKQSVWQSLYAKGLQNKKLTQMRHQNKVQKMDDECTFNPKTRSKSSKVFNQVQFIERTNIWQQNKTIKIIKQQQQELQKQYKQCTFTPIINKRKPKPKKDKQVNSMLLDGSNVKQAQQLRQFRQKNYQLQKSKMKSANKKVDFDEVKELIRKELNKIRL